MEDETNLALRSKVLYCSLNIESVINNLLTKHLLIKDKSKTKNFTNKAGIPFQSKISLLYDIEVFSNEELLTIELLMNFRNKFLHDIEYSSFKIILDDFDPGLRNRFFEYLDNKNLKNEETYESAFHNLYQKIVDIINEKVLNINRYSNKRIDFLKFQMEFINKLLCESLDFIGELNSIIENTQDAKTKIDLQKAKLKFEYTMNYKENIEKLTKYSNDMLIKSLIK